MDRKIVIYCYRMTHDYGINPCAFTEKYEPTPDLLTEGGCMSRIRDGIYREWREKIREEIADVYLMAITGHSRDNGRTRNKRGAFISPKYQHLIFVAKISDVISRTDYLTGPLSLGRQDALAYKKWWPNHGIDDSEYVLVSKKFSYFGKNPKEISDEVLEFFPKGIGHRKWEVSRANKDLLAPLISTIKGNLSEINHIEETYHPQKLK
ncbi:hypothetical protein [Lactococcus lactis]|uniref:Nmad2 family putative nucleotide modification protein n=1 Tax=Lactococcus lactis TaxID=1358 RepID=UPI0032E4F0F2